MLLYGQNVTIEVVVIDGKARDGIMTNP